MHVGVVYAGNLCLFGMIHSKVGVVPVRQGLVGCISCKLIINLEFDLKSFLSN